MALQLDCGASSGNVGTPCQTSGASQLVCCSLPYIMVACNPRHPLPSIWSASARREVRWSTCALTGQPLAPPIAADWLGNLFNRAAVLEFLLGRAAIFADDSAQARRACLRC